MSLSGRWRRNRGVAMVELALSLPVLVTVLVGGADFGRAFYTAIQLVAASRAGAAYGAHSAANSSDSSGIRVAAAYAAPNISLTANSTDIPDAGQYPVCASDDTGTATFTPQASPATCSSACPGSTDHMLCFVKVTTTKAFTMISSYIPGVPRTIMITRTAYQIVS
jgi:Flp pilus assembly protein TadG